MDRPIQTSDRVSSISARYTDITDEEIIAAITTDAGLARLRQDIRSMAASSLRQDQHRGLRGFIRKVTGQ